MKSSRPLKKKINRRQVLKTAAAAGAAAFMPTIIPAKALGRGGAVAPSERIVVAGLGIGSRGEYDLNWLLKEADVQFVAICDVRKVRREAIKRQGRQTPRQLRLPDVPRDARVSRDPHRHRRNSDGDRRSLARPGGDHGNEVRQGRLHREALLHDHRRGPRGRGDSPALWTHLSDRRPAPKRGQFRDSHRAGSLGLPRQHPDRSRATSRPGMRPR